MDASIKSPLALLVLVTLWGLAKWNLAVAARGQADDFAQRRRVFRTILQCAWVSACFGAALDQITVTISPDYFSFFKDLPAASPLALRLRASDLGFAAGVTPGLIAGVCFAAAAFIGIPGAEGASPIRPIRFLWIPAACIGLCCPVLIGRQLICDPGDYANSLENAAAAQRMLMVWGIHQSAYLGGMLGTIVATVWIRQIVQRRKTSLP